MKTIYKYNGVEISKRDWKLIQFIQTGNHNFTEAYYVYEKRKPRKNYDVRFFASWFNRTLKNIQRKGILREIPYAYEVAEGWVWLNPGINASKANFQCLTLHDAQMELKAKMNKII
jgi:hypothetical protein